MTSRGGVSDKDADDGSGDGDGDDDFPTTPEINLSVQFLLNCGSNYSLSCRGGSSSRAFDMIHRHGYIPYDTCQPYVACSSDSVEGMCPLVDTHCTPINICRTCMPGTGCVALSAFPNATVAEYGVYHNQVFATMAEIFVRGPVKASVDAAPLKNYTGGVMWDAPAYRSTEHHHGVSIVGWGYDAPRDRQYWIVRNSWGTSCVSSDVGGLVPVGVPHKRLSHVAFVIFVFFRCFSVATTGQYWGKPE